MCNFYLFRGKMVNNPLDYSNRIIFLMSFYSIYKGKYYIISASMNYNKIRTTALDFNRSHIIDHLLL